jgi:tRNA1Val (adenine37-N6)-methyltransferase
MANPYFRFKQFAVWHDRCAMKVGTDGVLLGAWCGCEGRKRILDVGTGTGLIALMTAQRNPEARIDAVEIDADAAGQAAVNFAESPWAKRLNVILADFGTFAAERDCGEGYDLIVSNPPYFERSLKAKGEQRTMARHTDSLPLERLIAGASRLLTADGVLALVYPIDADARIRALAAEAGLRPKRRVEVRGTPEAAPKRVLAEFRRATSEAAAAGVSTTFASSREQSGELVVELARHVYSPEYIALTRDFYLKM